MRISYVVRGIFLDADFAESAEKYSHKEAQKTQRKLAAEGTENAEKRKSKIKHQSVFVLSDFRLRQGYDGQAAETLREIKKVSAGRVSRLSLVARDSSLENKNVKLRCGENCPQDGQTYLPGEAVVITSYFILNIIVSVIFQSVFSRKDNLLP